MRSVMMMPTVPDNQPWHRVLRFGHPLSREGSVRTPPHGGGALARGTPSRGELQWGRRGGAGFAALVPVGFVLETKRRASSNLTAPIVDSGGRLGVGLTTTPIPSIPNRRLDPCWAS